ncbi:hypothetical protein C8R47DRAFT_1068114 [Mycena vitilis]|nr:hypothetical protein C8R47DRAFT_1068114 [Mycena vitilis]
MYDTETYEADRIGPKIRERAAPRSRKSHPTTFIERVPGTETIQVIPSGSGSHLFQPPFKAVAHIFQPPPGISCAFFRVGIGRQVVQAASRSSGSLLLRDSDAEGIKCKRKKPESINLPSELDEEYFVGQVLGSLQEGDGTMHEGAAAEVFHAIFVIEKKDASHSFKFRRERSPPGIKDGLATSPAESFKRNTGQPSTSSESRGWGNANIESDGRSG